MEVQIYHLLALFSLFLSIIAALKQNNAKKTHKIPNIPPSPWKLPIIGNMLNLVGSAPHRKLRDLAQKYGPLMHLQLGEIFFVVVSSPAYAREILKIHDANFASRPYSLASDVVFYGSTNIAFSPYGEYWRLLRKICTTEILSAKRVQSQLPMKLKEVNNLIKGIASEEGSVINLSQKIISLMFSITSMAAFGKKYNEQEEFIKVVREVLKLAGGFYIGDLFPSAKWIQNLTGMRPKLEDLHWRVDRILQIIIDDHRQSRTDKEVEDLVDVLLKFEGNSSDVDLPLTNNNIKAIIFDVFTGGSDTAATTINWAMAEMMKNPKILKKAESEVREVLNTRVGAKFIDETCIEEMKYLKAVIKETLRLHPAGPLLLPRECGQACEINGYHIPTKSKMVINAWAIATDPNYWTEPERFFPDRFIDSSIDFKGNNFEFIPFGAGRRICPGMNYGVASVELILALLLYHFDWKLPSGIKSEDLDMSELFGASVVKKSDLFLIPVVSRFVI